MAEPFIGDIRAFGFDFAPVGWLPCQGQLVSINDGAYQALFALLGIRFGGDGRTTFGIPDLRGRVPLGFGSAPGITPKAMGQMLGYEQVTLTENEIPVHTHTATTTTTANTKVYSEAATSDDPTNNYFGKPSENIYISGGRTAKNMATDAITTESNTIVGNGGSGQAHYNVQPSIVVNFCIAYQGIFSQRS
jgi:microcystin-dependent protein